MMLITCKGNQSIVSRANAIAWLEEYQPSFAVVALGDLEVDLDINTDWATAFDTAVAALREADRPCDEREAAIESAAWQKMKDHLPLEITNV